MFNQVLIDLLSGFRRYPCIPRKFWKRWYSLGIDNNYFDVSSERCFRCLVHSWLQKKTMQQRRHYQNFCRITGSNCNNGQVSFYSRSLYFSTFKSKKLLLQLILFQFNNFQLRFEHIISMWTKKFRRNSIRCWNTDFQHEFLQSNWGVSRKFTTSDSSTVVRVEIFWASK